MSNAECATDQYKFTQLFTVPSVNCWSLVGYVNVGNKTPFLVGSSLRFTAPAAGELFLGFNDNVYFDNAGSFTVVVTTP